MRTEQELSEFYKSATIQDIIDDHYNKIKRAIRKSTIGFALVLGLIALFVWLVFSSELPATLLLIVLIVAVFAFACNLAKDKAKICTETAPKLFNELMRFIAKDTKTKEILQQKQVPGEKARAESRVFNYSQFKLHGGNAIYFNLNDKNFMNIIDLGLYTIVVKKNKRKTARRTVITRTKRQRKYIFKGLFFSLDFQKDIKQDIYVIPKSRMGPHIDVSGREINLENSELSRKYKVFCEDEIEVRKVFSLSFMEHINEVNKLFPQTKYFAFRNGRRVSIFIEGESTKNLISVSLPLLRTEHGVSKNLNAIRNKISRFTQMAEVLDLEKNRAERILEELIQKNFKEHQYDLSKPPNEKFKEGNAASRKGLHDKSFALWASAAQEGHTESLNNLANAYLHGRGCATNEKKAFFLFHKSASKGSAVALYNVGWCYDHGRGCTQDYAEAIKYYQKAIDKNYPSAMRNMAILHVYGRGCEVDHPKAFNLYKEAAELGDGEAMCSLGYCYYQGRGCKKNYERAVDWYHKSVEKGNARAMGNLGFCYESGNGCEQNNAKAVELYTSAVEKGNFWSLHKLGLMYENGRTVTADSSKAFELYSRGAEKQEQNAMFNLGRCYLNGIGCAKDTVKAKDWLQKAADKGHKKAKEMLGGL